jgi:ankyrin repeat protein
MMIRKIMIGILFISYMQQSYASIDVKQEQDRENVEHALMCVDLDIKKIEMSAYCNEVTIKRYISITTLDVEHFLLQVFKVVSRLSFSVDRSLYDRLRFVFREYPAFLEYRNAMGWTLLHEAAHKNNQDMILFLLTMGADPNAQTDVIYDTPLHLAVRAHHKEATYLLERHHGISMMFENVLGDRPFDHFCVMCS